MGEEAAAFCRAGAAVLAVALVGGACSAGPSETPLASGIPGPTVPGTPSGDSTPGPPATAWELIVDDPAWGGAILTQIVPGGPGLVALAFAPSLLGTSAAQLAANVTPEPGPTASPPALRIGHVLTSPDGRVWRREPVDLGLESGLLASGAGGVVAVGWTWESEPPFGAHTFAWRSDDAESWERGPDPPVVIAALTDEGSGFLALGCRAASLFCVGVLPLASEDGRAWSLLPAASSQEVPLGLVGGEAGYIGWAGDPCEIDCVPHVHVWLSDDGRSWAAPPAGPSPTADSVVISDAAGWRGGYVAVGEIGTVAQGRSSVTFEPAAWISPDGRTWERTGDRTTFDGGTLTALLNVGDRLIAAGSVRDGDVPRAALWTSSDGLGWARLPDTAAFEGGRIAALAVGPAGLVAVGSIAAGAAARPAVWVGPLP